MAIHYGPLFEYEIVSLKNHQNRFLKNGISNSLQKILKYSMIVDNIVFCSIFVKIQIGPHSVVAIYTSLSHERKI